MKRLFLFLLAVFIAGILSFSLVLQAQTDYMVAGTYNQNAAGISYFGTWTNVNNVSATSGNYLETTSQETYLRFSCICDSFDVIYVGCNDCGYLLIFVDGYLVASPSTLTAPAAVWGLVQSITGLSNGYHIITIKRGPLYPAPPYGSYLLIDGFIIYNSYSAPPTSDVEIIVTVEFTLPETTPEPWVDTFNVYDETGMSHAVALDYSITAGELFIGVMIFSVLLITLIHFIRGNISSD